MGFLLIGLQFFIKITNIFFTRRRCRKSGRRLVVRRCGRTPPPSHPGLDWYAFVPLPVVDAVVGARLDWICFGLSCRTASNPLPRMTLPQMAITLLFRHHHRRHCLCQCRRRGRRWRFVKLPGMREWCYLVSPWHWPPAAELCPLLTLSLRSAGDVCRLHQAPLKRLRSPPSHTTPLLIYPSR